MDNKKTLTPISLVTSIFKFSIATWVNAAIYGISLILASFLLAPDVYGPFDLFISASNTLMTIAALGLDHSYIRFYHEPPEGAKDSRNLASMCMTISMSALFAFSLIITLVFPRQISYLFFNGVYYPRLIVLLCVNALFLLLARYFTITYRMRQDTKMYTLQSVLLQFFTRMFFLVGALVKPDLDTIVAFNVFGLGIFSLAYFLIQRKTMLPKKAEYSKEAFPPLLKYGIALAPSSVLTYINTLFSRIYVNGRLGDLKLGIYSMASTVTLALSIIQSGFATFWSAFIFENYKTEQKKIIRIHDYLMFAVMVLMCLLIMFQHVIFLILGSGYREGETIFAILLISPMLSIIAETTVYGIEIAKKTYYDAIGMALSVGGNIIFCLLFVDKYGMFGAALSLALSSLLMFIFRSVLGQHFYKSIGYPVKTIMSLLIIFILCVIAYLFASKPLFVSLAALIVMTGYCIIYGEQFRRCFALAKQILGMLTKKS